MNDINIRSVAMVVAAIIVALVVLGIIGGILNNIVPLAVVAVVAFILGRMSHRVNYLQLGREAAKRVGEAAQATASKAAERAEIRQQAQGYDKTAQEANQRIASDTVKAAEQAAAKAEAKATEPPARLAETEAPAQDDLTAAPKPEIKTFEQIQAEARLVEQEAAKKAQTMDVQAALEERRKRLLGDKQE